MINIVIAGVAVGKGRPKFARRGNFVTVYSPEKTKNYEWVVKEAATKAMNGQNLLLSAVAVEVYIFLTPPASWSKKKTLQAVSGEIRPASKPDIDNIIKALFDACNGIVWADDRQVVECFACKSYSSRNEVFMKVRDICHAKQQQ